VTVSRIAIITIGDELVEGRLVDTNAAMMSERLTEEGFGVNSHQSIPDDLDRIAEALRTAADRRDAVLVSGGLGPTTDDLTAEAAARAFGLAIVRFEEALDHVKRFFSERGRRMSPTNEKQADLPEGSVLLPNPGGTATGFALEIGACRLYFMPGVPRELEHIFTESVLPDLRTFLSGSPPHVATLKVFGKGESDVAQMLEGLENEVPEGIDLTVQYRATFPEIHIRLMVEAGDDDSSTEVLNRMTDVAANRLGKYLFATGGARLPVTFPQQVISELGRADTTVAVAEGCTGGEIARHLSEPHGGPEVFRGGVVAPESGSLPALLKIPAGDDHSDSAVDPAVAEAAAAAVRTTFDAHLGLAVVGHPRGGPQPGKLVVAIASADSSFHRTFDFPIEPDRFRRLAAYVSFAMLRQWSGSVDDGS
jgi:nicotinamide-nucleotide amidase